jgi:putative two-component system response regulator
MKSILIVDDDLQNLKQLGAQLTDRYEVSLAKSGELALQICDEEKPDLILLSKEMPGMNGFEIIECLKADSGLNHIPVIFLIGSDNADTELKCLEAGAADFIARDAGAAILRRRIDIQLELSACHFRQEQVVNELEDLIGVSFAELVECKDYNIAGHVTYSSAYAALLAMELFEAGIFRDEFRAADIEMIRRAAPFHDIGKIGISDMILLKRGPLTEEEYREVQRHTIIGGRMLKLIHGRIPSHHYLQTAMVIAEGHHERFDGSGYPRGLKGDAIPLCCRIMAVANVYDACVTDRVYRKGLSHEETCRIILEGAGTEFDPRLVDVFGRMRDRFALLHTNSHFSPRETGWSFFHEASSGS